MCIREHRKTTLYCLAVVVLGFATGQAAEQVSIESLLNEMIDRGSAARFPETNFRLRQSSSYDRLSKTPEDPKGWFANKDRTKNFLRVETHNGRQEWVIMDHHAPGAIVRSWMPDKRIPSGGKTSVDTKIRIYLDGSDAPVLEGHMLDLFNGTSLIPPPLAHKSLASAVSFFPIPYAKSCKVTLDQPPFYYILTYREYSLGTPIRSFTMKDFQAARPVMQRVGKTLLAPTNATKGKRVLLDTEITPQAKASVDLPAGEAAIRALSVTLAADVDPQVTRSLVLKMEFDGKPTVWCPVGDFFGTGVGIHAYQGWWRTVGRNGVMTCRWLMPYRESGKVTLLNLNAQPVPVHLEAVVGDFKWDERSLYFHANWRHQYPVATRPFSDFNYVTLTGRGVYVGDTLTVMNPVSNWWGEGDAKIWVDGEKFPSIFGTGTEDYYGYSWGGRHTNFYQHPFHAQPRAHHYDQLHPKTDPSERNSQGYSTETRTRALDAMPFGKSLQVDMGVWHWQECNMAYAVATYWYGDAETKTNRAAEAAEAAPPIVAPPVSSPAQPRRTARHFENAVEYETMKMVAAKRAKTNRAQTPQYLQTGGKRKLNVLYKTVAGKDLHLDLYYPTKNRADKCPVVIFTHGGGWAAGSRYKAAIGDFAAVFLQLVKKGFAVAPVTYRLAKKNSNVAMRDCVIDCKDAIRFLSKNSKALKIDPMRVYVMGDSAGGHIAQMLLLSAPESLPGDPTLAQVIYQMVVGVSWYGPCSFENTDLFNYDDRPDFRDRFEARIMGSDSGPQDKLARYREVSPINYLTATSPPLLMMQGDKDTTIPVKHAYYMQEKAKALHAPVEILIVKNSGHNWRRVGTDIEPSREVIVKRTVQFLVDHL